jgi:hypothetical protein
MKTYPSIPKDIIKGQPYYIFEKLDGSNIRVEWSRKNGFYKFGTRTQLLGEGNPFFPAIDLFMGKYSDDLERIYRDQRYDSATCFMEYLGPNSFAGNHEEDDVKDVVLFDVNPYKKGILGPNDFLKLFGDLHITEYLGTMNITEEVVRQVNTGEFEGMSFEGIVGKALVKKQLKMTKIKNHAWLDKLKSECKSDAEFRMRA